jgi:cytidylate kinase
MIICISGLSGSGKNTVAKLVAKKLKYRLIDPTFKSLALEKGMTLMQFQKLAEKDKNIDKEFDKKLIEEAKKGNAVVSTWLGPWMIKDASLKVWLYASKNERAKRIAKRDGMTIEQAKRHITKRDSSNQKRYMKLYNINIFDQSDFDLVLNTEHVPPEKSAEIIVFAAKNLSKKVGD